MPDESQNHRIQQNLAIECLVGEEDLSITECVEYEASFPDAVLFKGLRQCVRDDPSGFVLGIAVYTCRDRWKGNAGEIMIGSKSYGVSVARREQFRFGAIVPSIDGANGVYHVSGWHSARSGDGDLACRESLRMRGSPEPATFLEDLWSAGTVDRSVNTAAAHERAVRGVHYGVNLFTGQIAYLDYHTVIQKGREHMCLRTARANATISVSHYGPQHHSR
jgi:hypothetical protein